MEKVTILLVEDHALVREGLKKLFAVTPDIVVGAEALNGAQALDALKGDLRFDLVLLDMTMPGISGAELIARISALPESPPILVLSMHNEPQIALRAIKAGANGYITKDNDDPKILLAAVRTVASGERFIDAAIALEIAFGKASVEYERLQHERLSSRELDILALLAKGISVNEIAEQLHISNKTVSTHKARLMDKMGFASMTDLFRYAINHGLIE